MNKIKRFEDFELDERILRAVREEGYTEPTPIQSEAIPEILDGMDLMGTAQTGTGKTAAFCLPMLDILANEEGQGLRALILTPTRELALQVEASIRTYGRHLPVKSAVILGGVPMNKQITALRKKPEVLVATPGRLLDLMRQGEVRLNDVEFLVLDEADRMLDMGFIHDVRSIVAKVPARRQTLLFSATLSPDIAELVSDMLYEPVSVATTPAASVATRVNQKVMFVDRASKNTLLLDILKRPDADRVLVFTRTKHRADRLTRFLTRSGIRADVIHSNRTQNGRQRSLSDFDRNRVTVLVATDILARGIDVESISHVINYEIPNDPENYVHRVGRTARAGAAGIALSLCDLAEVVQLQAIEKLIGHPLPIDTDHAYHSAVAETLHAPRPANSGSAKQWRSFRPRTRSSGRRRMGF